MNGPKDLRAWIELLRREGELVEITQEVDPYLEITEIADRVLKGGGPALLFSNVKGSRIPLLINQFGTERRMLLAMGRDDFDSIGDEIGELLELKPPDGLKDKVRTLKRLKGVADARPGAARPLAGTRGGALATVPLTPKLEYVMPIELAALMSPPPPLPRWCPKTLPLP